jgi:hypothetical protein
MVYNNNINYEKIKQIKELLLELSAETNRGLHIEADVISTNAVKNCVLKIELTF